MMNENPKTDPTTTINLPPLEYVSTKYTLGSIGHILDMGGQKEVLNTSQITISPRIKETVYHTTDGQSLIITKRKKLDRPDEIDGVLYSDEQSNLKWMSHKVLDQFKEDVNNGGLAPLLKEISEGWNGQFNFHVEEKDTSGSILKLGLRPPQIGSLHAIGSHWSLSNQTATVVMPTGTGKTETMLATLVAYAPERILVVVPSQVLRDQTAKKFSSLGLLRKLKNLVPEARNPIVGIIKKRPQSVDDLKIFEDCNVIIATMSVLSEDTAIVFAPAIAALTNTLIIDEAHHIGASGWTAFREHFTSR